MNVLSTNRRKIGAIALIAAGIIAVSIPFLFHAPLNANTSTATNGNGSGGNTNANGNPNTNPTSSTSNQNTGSKSGGENSGAGTCDDQDKEASDTAGDPGHNALGDPSHEQGKANGHAYGHSKGDKTDKDPLHAIMNRLSRLGADSPSFHHHNATRTDNDLSPANRASTHSESSQADACQDDDNETESD